MARYSAQAQTARTATRVRRLSNSIGYRTLRAVKSGAERRLHEIELWEVSLVTFPMLPEARVQADAYDDEADLARTLAATFAEAREMLA
jgi:phage head maturation protease